MALDDFWMSVRAAAKLPVPQALVDSPRLDADAVDRAAENHRLAVSRRSRRVRRGGLLIPRRRRALAPGGARP